MSKFSKPTNYSTQTYLQVVKYGSSNIDPANNLIPAPTAFYQRKSEENLVEVIDPDREPKSLTFNYNCTQQHDVHHVGEKKYQYVYNQFGEPITLELHTLGDYFVSGD